MQQSQSYWDMQRQNEMKKIADAQNRLAFLDQQQQQQQMQQGNMMNGWNNQTQQVNSAPQSQAPVIPQQGIFGKIVNDFSEITARDVPMDGFGAFFFKADGTEMQRRVWDATNGSIIKTSYMPISEPNLPDGTNTPQNNFNSINEDVRTLREEMTNRFDALEKYLSNSTSKTTKPSTRAKKEGTADE